MLDFHKTLENEQSLDPENWEKTRQLAHQMLDDMLDYLQTIDQRPIWQKTPEAVKAHFTQALPQQPTSAEEIYKEFKTNVLPYNKGNIHPRFWSWVEGGGTVLGMLADMLASGMNPNNTIGDHAPRYVEAQVIDWSKQLFGFPPSASGLLVSGGAMANITAILVARNQFLAGIIRQKGLKFLDNQLVIYCSTETHNCLTKAAEIIGLGSDNLRKVPVNEKYQIKIEVLKMMLLADKQAGLLPFCIIGNAGTVNTGAIDPLDELLAIARQENCWFHVDGAFGALAKLVPAYQADLAAIEQADSLAFDFHKWLYVNYEVGCVLVREAKIHREAFALQANYLLSHERGLAAGPDTISNYGLELSRGFKALKVWMSLKEHGIQRYQKQIEQNIAQAFYLQDLIRQTSDLELLAEVSLNIVCYRYKPQNQSLSENELNDLNKEILMQLHENAIALPSYTLLANRYAIRVAISNHRSQKADFQVLVEGTLALGKKILAD
jgi:aromatic-L-amino-acid/L-tryptophan decarboxylase